MTKKSLLFIGIFLLVVGILIRSSTDFGSLGLILILVGVACKTLYIIGKIKTGEYIPGKEMYLLITGLALFLGGIYMRKNNLDAGTISANVFIFIGLSLKILFIIGFVRKVKAARHKHLNTNLGASK